MKRLVVLGSGTAGTMVANKLRPRLDRSNWSITVVDQDGEHVYQPGLLLLPFGPGGATAAWAQGYTGEGVTVDHGNDGLAGAEHALEITGQMTPRASRLWPLP